METLADRLRKQAAPPSVTPILEEARLTIEACVKLILERSDKDELGRELLQNLVQGVKEEPDVGPNP